MITLLKESKSVEVRKLGNVNEYDFLSEAIANYINDASHFKTCNQEYKSACPHPKCLLSIITIVDDKVQYLCGRIREGE